VAIYFCASSAIVKCYVQEQGSGWMVALLDAAAGHHLYLACITGVEVIAATDVAPPFARFRQDFAGLYRIIEITPTLVTRRMAFAETYALRGYDAMQLAAAMEVHARGDILGLPVLTLISADEDLNVAASAEGLVVENPNIH
jgi:predicted nucleic acid-binding protein